MRGWWGKGWGFPFPSRQAEPGVRPIDNGFSTHTFAFMWPQQDLSGILARLAALESAQHAIESEGTPGEHGAAIDDLRARQDVLQGISGNLRAELDRYGAQLKVLTAAVGEGIQRVERDERRIKATVARARKELADSGFEHEGLEAEATDLRLVDGAGGDEQGVPAVPEELAGDSDTPSSVPGVSVEELQRIRGL